MGNGKKYLYTMTLIFLDFLYKFMKYSREISPFILSSIPSRRIKTYSKTVRTKFWTTIMTSMEARLNLVNINVHKNNVESRLI